MDAIKETEYNFLKYRIIIPEELDHLIKGFLSRRSDEFINIQNLINQGDLVELLNIGHKIKGHGSSFGFEGISIIGDKIERAAKAGSKTDLSIYANEYGAYLTYISKVLSEAYEL